MEIDLRVLSKDIIDYKLDEKIVQKIQKDFYSLMRKYGIKEGEWNSDKTGRTIANPEWTICQEMFIERIKSQLTFSFLFEDVPDDLKAYE